jgi:hypothetical protein
VQPISQPEYATYSAKSQPAGSPHSHQPLRPTYFDLVHDALQANPDGLKSSGIIAWLRFNRSEAFLERGEEKIRVNIPATCSTNANKSPARLWRFEDTSKEKGYIWKLPKLGETHAGLSVSGTRGGSMSELPTDRSRDSGQSGGDAQSEPPKGPGSRTLVNASAASILLRLYEDAPLPDARSPTNPGAVRGIPRIIETDSSEDDTDEHTENDEAAHAQSIPDKSFMQQQNVASKEDNDVSQVRTASEGDAPEVQLGRLVVAARGMKRKCERLESDIKIRRSKIPNINELSKQAEELAQRAEAARLQANAAKTTLKAAEEETKKLTAAEEELQEAQRKFTDTRKQLQID